MILTILIAAVVVLAVLALYIHSRPAQFRVSRFAVIPAPASVVFAEVNDFHQWNAWSPWARMDDNAVNTFEGKESGVGSIFRWKSRKTGEGGMTITDSQPDRLVRIKLDFLKPFKATNIAEFAFEPQGESTLVTWSMTGTNTFAFKAMRLLMDCDKMCGGMFEQGLDNLKAVVQQAAVVR